MGITPEEIKHVALLAMTTLGFPSTVTAYTWVNDELRPALTLRQGLTAQRTEFCIGCFSLR